MALLNDEQMMEAARRMAIGTARRTLVQEFMVKLQQENLLPDEDEQKLRNRLSNELASAQPGNARFAETKYGDLVAIEQHVLQEAFTEEHIQMRDGFVEFLKEQMLGLKTTLEKVNALCDEYLNSADCVPTTPQEFAALQNTQLRLTSEFREVMMLFLKLTATQADPLTVKALP